MDTSVEYIEMCEKAKEIQNMQENAVALLWDDIIEIKSIFKPLYRRSSQFGVRQIIEREHFIWLPRQDQLQEMIKGLPINHVLRISKFVENLDDGSGKILEWDSMEQLWLAFVMKEKYGKTWNGKEWLV